MTTEGTKRSPDGARSGTNGGPAGATGIAAVARDIGDQARGAAGEVADRLPNAAAAAQEAFTQTQRRLGASSDETLAAGTMFSVGVALGLLLAGANRLLVATALIPAAAMGATMLDRTNRERTRPRR